MLPVVRREPDVRERMDVAGRARVRERFLLTREREELGNSAVLA